MLTVANVLSLKVGYQSDTNSMSINIMLSCLMQRSFSPLHSDHAGGRDAAQPGMRRQTGRQAEGRSLGLQHMTPCGRQTKEHGGFVSATSGRENVSGYKHLLSGNTTFILLLLASVLFLLHKLQLRIREPMSCYKRWFGISQERILTCMIEAGVMTTSELSGTTINSWSVRLTRSGVLGNEAARLNVDFHKFYS